MLRNIALIIVLLVFSTAVRAVEHTGTASGHVVSARNVNKALDGVIVSNDRTADTAVVQNGTYSLTLPIGDVTLYFEDEAGNFTKTAIKITVPANSKVECNVAMIPADIPAPASLVISPINPIVLVGGVKQFECHFYATNGSLVSLSPVWSLLEGPDRDALDWATGILAPKQPGQYRIVASVGAIKMINRVNVTAGPRLRCLYVGVDDIVAKFIQGMGYDLDATTQVRQSHYASDSASLFDNYSVVVLDYPQALDVTENGMIRTYLASGGGIVITDHCYSRFAEKTKLITISISPVPGYDLKQMADWFGIDNPRAGGVLEDKISEMHLDLDQPFGLQLEQGYSLYDCPLGAPVIWGEGADQFVVRIAGHPVANAGVYGVSFPSVRGGEYLFAFTHTYGPGRVYYQGDIVGSPNYPWVIELFGGGLNWAAGRI